MLTAVAFFAVAVAGTPFEVQVLAQGNGDRGTDGQGERGQRRGREGRRGGGPGGDRQGDREGGRNRENGNNDRTAEARPATPPPAVAPSATSFGTVSESERFRKQASDIITLHDKNGNKILEGDELAKLGMSKAADTNQDGTITHNDLVAFYSKSASGAASNPTPGATTPAAKPATTTSDTSGEGGGKSERLIVNKTRKSYRFKSTKERNDNWKFSSKDANADGQVSMSEYSSAWTDRTATEFLRYDKDNDGMITVEEAK